MNKFIKQLFDRHQNLHEHREDYLRTIKKHNLFSGSQAGQLLKLSKEIINDVVQNRLSEAKAKLRIGDDLIKRFHKDLFNLKKTIGMHVEKSNLLLKDLQHLKLEQLEEGFEKAKEEFLEGKILYTYISQGKIYMPTDKHLNNFDTYIGALSDFCGELVRRARSEAIASGNNVHESIKKYRKTTEDIFHMISEYAYSNSSGNRQKLEQLKGFLDMFDKFSYDLKVTYRDAVKTRE